MSLDTVILAGNFISTGVSVDLNIRSDVDFIEVYNFTEAASPSADTAVRFYWQRGMAANDGFVWTRNAGGTADLITTSGALTVNGFTLFDTSLDAPGAAIAVTSTTNATQPVVATAGTNLVDGDIVRLIDITGAPNLGGIDFQVDMVTSGVDFRIANAFANAPGAGTSGFYRRIPFDPIFYPRRRFIVNITQAAQAVVTTSVDHGYTVGQEMRFQVPDAANGMNELDEMQGTIVAVTASTFTVDIDTTGFTAFTFPLAADVPYTPAQVVPMGQDTGVSLAQNVNILAGATRNEAMLGIRLAAGQQSPAGQNGDLIYWKAGRVFSVDNV